MAMNQRSGGAAGPQPAAPQSPSRAPDPGDEAGNALSREAIVAASPAVANGLGEYTRSWVRRIKGGESGVLPILAGLVILVIIFQLKNHIFLSAGNLTNLMTQGAYFMLLGMGEVFVLLLGEIDLSVGYVSGVGAAITALLMSPSHHVAWWLAALAGLAATTVIGLIQGTLVTKLRLPSFVVTLAGLLGWQGVMLWIFEKAGAASGGTISIPQPGVIYDIVNGQIAVAAGWILLAVVVIAFAAMSLTRDIRRRKGNLATAPASLTWIKIAAVAVAGVVLVAICNTNRSNKGTVEGVPWVIPMVLVVLGVWSFLLSRTRYGRYIYAIGGNAEAARRAGINVGRIRLIAFGLTGLTAGLGGIVYESRLGSVSNGLDGGTYVLYAVAAAVIGGTSLFGGRGKPLHAVLGGVVIAAIYNGLGLLGLGASPQDMITALVLLAAVIIDAFAQRKR
jgi:D-xylose transport system permease protein